MTGTTPFLRAQSNAVVIGTRGSPLALVQAEMVRAALLAAHPGLSVTLETIRTTGDRFLDRPLSRLGGKGLFTKEIENALLDGRVDIAVHSLKDVPTVLPSRLMIACVLPREDVRDVLIARAPGIARIADLPEGARVGTVSLRRAAQARACRPDLQVVPLRGNVAARMAKIKAGEADATFLALAGLKRLGLAGGAGTVMSTDDMLPAVAQGAIGVECRAGDARVRALLAPLDDPDTHVCIAAERACLAALDGSCRTPIAGLALREGETLTLRAMIAAPDGSWRLDARRQGPVAEAEAMGRDAGEELRGRAGPDFFAALEPNG